MSNASAKGVYLERKVAALLRKKLSARVQRDKRSGAGINKSDINDYYGEIPLHIEIKNQETLKPKEWFRQAEGGSSRGQAPTVVFSMDEEVMAMLRFSDLVNLIVEIKDQKAEIEELRAPEFKPDLEVSNKTDIKKGDKIRLTGFAEEDIDVEVLDTKKLGNKIGLKLKGGANSCRNDHLSDEHGYCNIKDCKYSRGYRPPKAKRR